ncbi:MAG: hypothetical protein NZ602_08350 [Thermoguttaceae bacterium]|nr:hypothetical protein [Thermoguttaceae bacterium]MDW8039331.1 hypothetical protein [Thermoguttaceae bacterium]
MGRVFASCFGPVAFLVVLLRSLLAGTSVEPTLERAWVALVIFSGLGGWLGWIADTTIQQSVHTQLTHTLAPADTTGSKPSRPSSS